MILYESDMGATPSSEDPGTDVELGINGVEVGMAEDEVEVEEAGDGRDDESDEEEEGLGEEVGIAERVVGKSVTVINVPEAAGAFEKVAESRGRTVEARWRQ
jgi:hypothetical protein